VIPAGANELEQLTYVPGVVGDVVEWIVGGANRPNRMMALGSALVTVGTLIGHRVQGPTRSATHLYVICLAPTGAGKDWPLQSGPKLLDDMGRSDLLGMGSWASAPGFINRLKRSALMVCYMDELGDELAKVNAKSGGGGVWLTAIIGLLKQCYNAFGQIQTAEKVEAESVRIVWPAVSILGVATPQKFFGALGAEDLESGFANRLLILPFEHYRKPPEQTPPDGADEPPRALLDALRALPKRVEPDVLDATIGVGGGKVAPAKPPLISIGWGEGAAEVYKAFSREIDALVEGDQSRYELSQRACENAVRIATIVAVGRGSPFVDCEDIERGIVLARQSLEAACGGVEKYMRKYSEFPQFCDKVLEWLKAQPERFAAEWEVERKFGRSARNVWEVGNVIRQLIKEQRIVQASRGSSFGPTARGWRAYNDDEL
jgi:hypothetical protein